VTEIHEATANRPSLLAVFAHPDDESLACGGLLAWCAAVGVRTSLLCLTHGEHGGQSEAASLAAVRARELREAAAVLGISDVTLLAHQDGMLPWTDATRLEGDIRDAVARAAADVVITFDEDGLYWHPDHVAVHERTTAAVLSGSGRRPALYYVTLPAGSMRSVVEHAATLAAVQDPTSAAPTYILGIADPDAFGSCAPAPTLVVDTGDFARQKLLALHCHRSQLPKQDALTLVTTATATRLLGIEHYRRAGTGPMPDTFLDRLASCPDQQTPPDSWSPVS
jgi:LmbE family N-acetylglucosaminyl deacetylase